MSGPERGSGREKIAVENAEVIRNLGQEFSDRFSVLVEHLTKVGSSLGKAIESYNAAVASFEGRILPAARRFRSLGAGGRKVVEQLQPVDARARALNPNMIETEVGDGTVEADGKST